jgi:hypothetical protein
VAAAISYRLVVENDHRRLMVVLFTSELIFSQATSQVFEPCAKLAVMKRISLSLLAFIRSEAHGG